MTRSELYLYTRIEGDDDFELLALVDDLISLRVNQYYYSYDTFTLLVPLTKDNISRFQAERLLLIDHEYFYIDHIEATEAESVITVEGKSLLAKASNRIVTNNLSITNTPNYIVSKLLTDNIAKLVGSSANNVRWFPYLRVRPNTVTGLSSIQFQDSYGNVMEDISMLAETYDFGFSEVATNENNPLQEIVIYKGRNLANTVQFDQNYDNLFSETFEHSTFDYSNYAYVLGEGEGTARTKVIVNQAGTGASGIDLVELYVDARDLQSATKNEAGADITLTPAQYQAALQARGKDKLAERVEVLDVNGIVDVQSTMFKFGSDWKLGDTVLVVSELFGFSKATTITAVEQVWDDTGYSVTPTFGKQGPTLIDLIKRG
jgi:hypothetical protein